MKCDICQKNESANMSMDGVCRCKKCLHEIPHSISLAQIEIESLRSQLATAKAEAFNEAKKTTSNWLFYHNKVEVRSNYLNKFLWEFCEYHANNLTK